MQGATSAMVKPAPREVVQMLMSQKQYVRRYVHSSDAKQDKKLHHAFECPNKELCKNGGIVVFEKGSGFSNIFRHLRVCLASGD